MIPMAETEGLLFDMISFDIVRCCLQTRCANVTVPILEEKDKASNEMRNQVIKQSQSRGVSFLIA